MLLGHRHTAAWDQIAGLHTIAPPVVTVRGSQDHLP
jgi:hypothetical protein